LGYGLNLLSIKAGEAYGVDIDEKAIEYARGFVWGRNPKLKELKVYNGYNLPYEDKFFDVVASIDVIEHVEEYDKFVDELLRVAKKAVILSTPNRRPENTNPDGTPKNHWHLREWSRKELNEILSKHAAKIEWHHVNGPWEGPFTVTGEVQSDTMTLTPALLPKK
jgi:ubiquinone/menaquinone biosynthesis C-methylase UbiE